MSIVTTRKWQLSDWMYQVGRTTKSWLVNVPSGTKVDFDKFPSDTRDFWASLSTTNRGSKVVSSINHPEWGHMVRKSRVFTDDVGGPFFSQSKNVTLFNPETQTLIGHRDLGTGFEKHVKYVGPVFVVAPWGALPPAETLRDLKPVGSTAIARCKPTNNIADVSTFLAELYSQGLPKLLGATLWKQNVDLARSSGEEYLNQEFGWKPLVSDVSDIMFTLTHARTMLNQYERNSGKLVRRRYEFPIEMTQSDVDTGAEIAGIYSNKDPQYLLLNGKTLPHARKRTSTWRRTWFSGAFTYHMPTGYYSRNAMERYGAQADALLGTGLTPETLWNAAPWSWAIDWFSNAGDVISNLSDWSTDGLVLKYGYIMEHTVRSDLYYSGGPANYQSPLAYPSPVLASVETKRRDVATPFGFEVTWGGLSPRQLAIAAALGISRK